MTTTDSHDQQLLHEYLERHEDERCPQCAYRLHRLTGDRCPECGTVLRLSVGRRETPIGAWLLLAVPLWVATGEGLYNLFWILSSIARGDMLTNFEPIDLILCGLTLAATVLAVGTLVVRPWYVKMPVEVQWSIAAPVACITTMVLVVDYTYYNFWLY